jgi:hypothetical protein
MTVYGRMALLLTDADAKRAREPGGGGQQKLVRDLLA